MVAPSTPVSCPGKPDFAARPKDIKPRAPYSPISSSTGMPDSQEMSVAAHASVSVIVVTYETPAEMLRLCLDSVAQSRYPGLELLVVDNSHTSKVADAVQVWQAEQPPGLPEVRLLRQYRNLGYAAATNCGIEASSGDLVFLLNPDAVVEPTAIGLLVEAAQRRPEAAGFAPKVVLEADELILDSVGIDLYLRGQGAQRGLGEPDIGQFDVEERVAGLCFAAALVRRWAFSPQGVGELDERFFMFYEDVDWSMRASMRAQAFWTVPMARVHHVHSASTRHLASDFKTRLIQRNLIWTAAKNLERRRAVKVVLEHTARHLLGGAVSRHPWVSVRIIVEAWAGFPRLASARRQSQRQRLRSDSQVLTEPAKSDSFDSTLYRPTPSVDTLLRVLSRRYVVAPDPALGRLVFRLTQASKSKSVANPGQVAAWVRESGVAIMPGLEWLLAQLEAEGG
ncbi:MAG TPA: glycosyltransferase family 2 protein [Candidatus Dormibacteraeota bacterium]|nr:glycosyltransferase family 2 protein [Candidatus Dormibacteraeota bacterium]